MNRSHVPGAVRSASMEPEGRPQDHCTPAEYIEPAYRVMGGIDLDPATNPGSLVRATRSLCFVDERDDSIVLPKGFEWGNGLEEDWSGLRIWLQPNWDELEPWVERANFYAQRGAEIFALLPVRTHRLYWKYVWEAQGITFLPPITFVGQRDQLPLPCCYVYWGPNPEKFALWTSPLGQPFTEEGRPLRPRTITMTDSATAEIAALKMDGALGFVRKHPNLTIIDVADLDADLAKHLQGMSFAELGKLLEGIEPTKKSPRERPPRSVSGPQQDLPDGEGEGDGKGKKLAPRKRDTSRVDTALRAYFAKLEGFVTIKVIEDAVDLGVSRPTLRRSLNRLKEAGEIEQHGDTRGAEYRRYSPPNGQAPAETDAAAPAE